jgi:hypothetical protein
MDVEIRAIELTGRQLETLPADERVFLVQIAHLANTIMVLQKWLIFCQVRAPSHKVESEAATTQQMLVMRVLSGVLYEGWQVLHESYFKAQLSKKYHAKLTDDGKKCLATLKKYFDRHENKIKTVRNKFAFHFDRATVEKELSLLEQDKPYHLYLSDFQGNCLYYLSEELVGLAMLRSVQDDTAATGITEILQRLFDELVRISRAFAGFIGACLLLVVRENLPSLKWDDLERISVSDPPLLDRVQIPFFVSKPDIAMQ